MGYYFRPDKRDYIIKIIGIAIIVFVIWKIGKAQLSLTGLDNSNVNPIEQMYREAGFYFPELDNNFAFRSMEGNWVIEKYSKYGKEWRLKLFIDLGIKDKGEIEEINDLIDGTSKYLNRDNKTLRNLKRARYNAALTLEEKYKNLKIGYLQEAKRTIEEGRPYPDKNPHDF